MKNLLTLVLLVASVSGAQAQVVQLPSVGSFGVSTTVSVPDQGTAAIGGTGFSRGSRATDGFGPALRRGGTSQLSSSSMSMTATVIDLAAMDEAILDAPAGSSATANFAPRSHGKAIVNTLSPQFYARQTGQSFAEPPRNPNDWAMAMGASGNAQVDMAANVVGDGSDVRYYMHRAAEAQHHGRLAAARVYYQMAVERLTPKQNERMLQLQAKYAAAAKRGADPKSAGTANADSTSADPANASEPMPAAGGASADGSAADAAQSPFDAPATTTDMNASPF
ncbi:MAG: hypothetical protein IT423_19240 [Pirellulaceae bacterium]|nr:hypothetical protein [Pirellulaceae bacterium]